MIKSGCETWHVPGRMASSEAQRNDQPGRMASSEAQRNDQSPQPHQEVSEQTSAVCADF